jgi:hypothetical protein
LETFNNNKIALVTNVLDDVCPSAVNALLESGYKVLAHDPAFQETDKQENDYSLTRHWIRDDRTSMKWIPLAVREKPPR